VVNGPITPQDFDKIVGAGAASSTHFLHGYDVTYDSNFTNESIESTLFTFASPADASGFTPQVLGNVGAATLSPTTSRVSSIPGSILLTGTKKGSDGFYVIDVVAQKGPTIMAIEYSNDSAPTGVPDVLNTSASQQYALIQEAPRTGIVAARSSPRVTGATSTAAEWSGRSAGFPARAGAGAVIGAEQCGAAVDLLCSMKV
jgi:hypothetical protein